MHPPAVNWDPNLIHPESRHQCRRRSLAAPPTSRPQDKVVGHSAFTGTVSQTHRAPPFLMITQRVRARALFLGSRTLISHLNHAKPLPTAVQGRTQISPRPPWQRLESAHPLPRAHPAFAQFCTAVAVGERYEECMKRSKKKRKRKTDERRVDFTKVDLELLPSVIIIGRPNVGKSALFNRLIRRKEALVYNTPDGHVTRDVREGIAKLGDLRFRVLDSAGLETAASSGDVLGRTTTMTAAVLARCQCSIFLIDVRAGLQPLDLEVGKWLRKNAPGMRTVLAMNKSESLDDCGLLTSESAEAHVLGFGDPIAISAETGLGMAELYEALRPLLEDCMIQMPIVKQTDGDDTSNDEAKVPLQLAIVGRPNVGKSTLLNSLLQEDRVLVGPEAGLTRDSIRTQFKYDGRTIYLVDTAGWIERSGQEKGPASLSVIQSRRNLMRAHIVGLVLDAEEIAKARSSMKHAEVAIARQAVEEGRGLVVIVNKMDLLSGKQSKNDVLEVVPKEIQTVIPQVNGIPVVFVSALEGEGMVSVMRTVVDTYDKWCSRLSTARLNRWLLKSHGKKHILTQDEPEDKMRIYASLEADDVYARVWLSGTMSVEIANDILSQSIAKAVWDILATTYSQVMSRHSWKNQATQSRIKYFTQVKARPPTFVAFVKGKKQLSSTDIRFLTKSLKEDFELGGIPIRIMQRFVVKNTANIDRTISERSVIRKAANSDSSVALSSKSVRTNSTQRTRAPEIVSS